jgi:hypothetical protein
MAPIIFEDTVCIPTFLRTKYSYAVGKLFEGKIHEQLAAWILIDIIEDDFITEPNDVDLLITWMERWIDSNLDFSIDAFDEEYGSIWKIARRN